MACCQLSLSWKIAMKMKLLSPILKGSLIISRTQTLPHGYRIILSLWILMRLYHLEQASPRMLPRACNLGHLS
eukprot:3621926-Ditylum_brightwellii.AAC.1